jgi:hypothetical protein|uniref:Uncharacterized protein n=1 Tax=Panagrolaimus davidi TaxID=227884 RepID=A0A914PS90_9BILA
MQNLVQEYREVNPFTKTICIRSHFSLYRDISFVAIDHFKRNVDREQFDRMYESEFQKLPIRISPLLDPPDQPPKAAVIACRRIFMPLDIY